MRNLILFTAVAFIMGLTQQAFAQEKTDKKLLYHVVSFKFKADAPKERIKAVEEAFMALKTKIPAINSLTWGTNNSPEKLNKGFTHCWVLTFKTEADRDAYLPHPDHKAFGATLKGIIEDVFVVDFWGE